MGAAAELGAVVVVLPAAGLALDSNAGAAETVDDSGAGVYVKDGDGGCVVGCAVR